jgi:hypothetical protein
LNFLQDERRTKRNGEKYYTDEIKKQQEATDAAALAQKNADAWRQILIDYPDVPDKQGIFNMTLAFCEGEITSEQFRVLLETQPPGFGITRGDDRPELIERIMKVIDPKGRRFAETLNSKMSRGAAVGRDDYANEERRLTYINEEKRLGLLSRIELIAELEKRNLRSELRSMSVEEVSKRRDAYRLPQALARSDGYPTLPQFLVLPQRVQADQMTGEFIRRLVKEDYKSWRWLVSRFGPDQITERSQ